MIAVEGSLFELLGAVEELRRALQAWPKAALVRARDANGMSLAPELQRMSLLEAAAARDLPRAFLLLLPRFAPDYSSDDPLTEKIALRARLLAWRTALRRGLPELLDHFRSDPLAQGGRDLLEVAVRDRDRALVALLRPLVAGARQRLQESLQAPRNPLRRRAPRRFVELRVEVDAPRKRRRVVIL